MPCAARRHAPSGPPVVAKADGGDAADVVQRVERQRRAQPQQHEESEAHRLEGPVHLASKQVEAVSRDKRKATERQLRLGSYGPHDRVLDREPLDEPPHEVARPREARRGPGEEADVAHNEGHGDAHYQAVDLAVHEAGPEGEEGDGEEAQAGQEEEPHEHLRRGR